MFTLGAIVVGGYTLIELAIFVVIIAAIIGLVYIALQQFGVPIPDWLVKACMIVFVAFVIIILIKIVASL